MNKKLLGLVLTFAVLSLVACGSKTSTGTTSGAASGQKKIKVGVSIYKFDDAKAGEVYSAGSSV